MADGGGSPGVRDPALGNGDRHRMPSEHLEGVEVDVHRVGVTRKVDEAARPRTRRGLGRRERVFEVARDRGTSLSSPPPSSRSRSCPASFLASVMARAYARHGAPSRPAPRSPQRRSTTTDRRRHGDQRGQTDRSTTPAAIRQSSPTTKSYQKRKTRGDTSSGIRPPGLPTTTGPGRQPRSLSHRRHVGSAGGSVWSISSGLSELTVAGERNASAQRLAQFDLPMPNRLARLTLMGAPCGGRR